MPPKTRSQKKKMPPQPGSSTSNHAGNTDDGSSHPLNDPATLADLIIPEIQHQESYLLWLMQAKQQMETVYQSTPMNLMDLILVYPLSPLT